MKRPKVASNLLPILPILLFLATTHAAGTESYTSPIWSIQFSPDGSQLAVGRYQWVQLWDLESRQVIQDLEPHSDAVRCLRFSVDGKSLFAGGGLPAQNGELHVWEIESGEQIQVVECHADTIEAVAVSADGSRVFTASMDEQVSVIALESGEIERTLTQHIDRVFGIDFRPDGKYFVTGGKDKNVKIWNAQTYEELVNFDQNDAAVYSVAFAPEGDMIVSGSADTVLRSWRVTESVAESGRIQTQGALVRVYNGHQGAVYAIDCGMRNNLVIAVSGSADKSVIVWSLRSGGRLYTFTQSTDEIYAVDLSADGRFVAAGGRDGIARVWDLSNGELVSELTE